MKEFVLSLSTRIVADETRAPIRSAADILRRDMREALTGRGPENAIRVVWDASLPEEGYRLRVSEDAILAECADELGAVYALLAISERFLGFLPLGWWNDQRVPRREQVSVPAQTIHSPAYAVRFRGWFINDEVLFTGWKTEEGGKAELWRRTFETILRCGGNMVIPGTDRAHDGRALCEMALDMGLWLTQHHTELLGARMFARVYPDLTPSYRQHPAEFERLWQEAIDLYGGRKVVWAVGFRGQGDCAFWENEAGIDTDEARGAYISRVMRRQMELVRRRDPEARFCTNLYGEMMGLYRKGCLDIPPEVIKLWGDNGYGRMVSRRQNNDNPRVDSMPRADEPGENGIYYHVGFYDLQAANHITMLQNPPQAVADELGQILKNGGGAMWNVNAGSVKPHMFMLELVRRMWIDGQCDAREAARDYARAYYGDEAVAPLFTAYAESAVRYGPNEDDRAGDQFYHFPLRALAHALLRGETEKPVRSLLWVAESETFGAQVEALGKIAYPGIASWRAYRFRCENIRRALPEDAALLMDDTLILQAMLHETGCEGLYAFCQACAHLMRGNELQAYLWTDRALEAHRKGLAALRGAERGRFVDLYKNDCFTNVALTVQVLEGVRGFIRIRGDGENLYDWEKKWLLPEEETKTSLQTHRTAQLGDDALCRALAPRVELARAF